MANEQDTHSDRDVDFGFTKTHVPLGTHACHIYENDEERNDAFLQFLLKGRELNELAAGFSDDLSADDIAAHLPRAELDEWLEMARTADVYFENDRFDPDGMLTLLRDFHQRSLESSFTGARVIGEMVPAIYNVEGSDRLLEYEARVNVLLRDHPMTVMCQYHAPSFSGATLMDVLKSHPLMVVRGAAVHNPFYVSPESLLESH